MVGAVVDPTEILEGLARVGEFPSEALAAATERRAEMTPIFIRLMESYIDAPDPNPASTRPLFFIFHLFGEWRETAAYRLLARLLSLPIKPLEDVLGDAITATSHRVMASVFDGDPQPLFGIILDENADEYVRSRMFDAVVILTLRGEIDRPLVEQFARDGFEQIRPRENCYVWEGWQEAVARLGLVDLRDQVAEAFRRDYIGPDVMDFADFEEDLQRTLTGSPEPWEAFGEEHALFGDTREELSDWAAFTEKDVLFEDDDDELWDDDDDDDPWDKEAIRAEFVRLEPHVNPLRHVGRNDPCPCGSGKKYKKCCLQAGT
jgi:hypothetical protein